MKWLIIGTGGISRAFALALTSEKQEITAVLSRKIERAESFGQEFHALPFVDFDQALKIVDAVYIATPNATHYDFAFHALKHGKNVLVEKPMTHSYQKTKALFDLATSKNVQLMEAYAHITNPQVALFKSGNIETNYQQLSSKIKNNSIKSASTFSKKMFGGVIPDLGVYPLALSILINGKVKSYQLRVDKFLNDVEVSCFIKLVHENMLTSQFKISKIENGDNAVYINRKKVWDSVSAAHIKNRMIYEVREFVQGHAHKYQWISLEVARLVEAMKKDVNKTTIL